MSSNLAVNQISNIIFEYCNDGLGSFSSQQIAVGLIHMQVTAVAAARIQTIVADTTHRMKHYPQNPTLLEGGYWYPNDYFSALSAGVDGFHIPGQESRLEKFIKNGTFFHGHAPDSHFHMENNPNMPTGIQTVRFILNDGVKPTEALRVLSKGLTLSDCGNTCQAGVWAGILAALGENRFDEYFGSTSPGRLIVHFNSADNILHSLYTFTLNPSNVKRGDVVFFSNISEYHKKHPNGEAGAFVTICLNDTPGNEKFTTLGLASEGMSAKEIREVLREEFNKKPIGSEFLHPKTAGRLAPAFREAASYANVTYTAKKFLQQGGGKMRISYTLCANRIQLLMQLPPKDGHRLLAGWAKKYREQLQKAQS